MILFSEIDAAKRNDLYYKAPGDIKRNSSKEIISISLGGTLYSPGIKENLDTKIVDGYFRNTNAMIMCLEDSISDNMIEVAEENIISIFERLGEAVHDGRVSDDNIPWLFIRVRNADQVSRLLEYRDKLGLLTGFVFPKVRAYDIEEYMSRMGDGYYFMPILETPEIIHKESRIEELLSLKETIDRYKKNVLNIRVGVTDFSSLYGLRREKSATIYDNLIVSDCLKDIANIFSRAEDDYIISGPVWEHFSKDNNELFMKEIEKDKCNGMIGKTLIHPSQVNAVNAMYSVSEEEYKDALTIIESSDTGNNGVVKSNFKNKMNEVKPHYNWAKRIIKRAGTYGVLKYGIEPKEILQACIQR